MCNIDNIEIFPRLKDLRYASGHDIQKKKKKCDGFSIWLIDNFSQFQSISAS